MRPQVLCLQYSKLLGRNVNLESICPAGVAKDTKSIDTEDTITLTVHWENLLAGRAAGGRGTAVYTASWIAPPSDVHSQQRFFYMGHVSIFCSLR